ncbi:MAG: Hsp20 family protein [Syntrophothermus sp.]|uniref:Hsp20/alpha crystallin family protein n=1 Tax=Syntrophothermus sp. TaxID=2736299 RepID=UPI0025811E23|nr:Hsp20/alpha crystallin family protein [Syntrophothermus sp.]NSW84476.1 Hsp20 family protein [Syntrophothermus sp.]
MDWKKLAPWNWFKKEEEEGTKVPVARDSARSSLQHPMVELQREIDRVFNTFFRDWPLRSFPSLLGNSLSGEMGFLRPTLDLSATDEAYTATIEIPGVDPKDVKVELRKNNLFITGEKKQEKEHKGNDHYCVERSYGMFRRILTLPEDVDVDKISASYKDGVMTLSIPRKALPPSEQRQIEVTSA